jgi:hypothetical protein
MYSIVKALSWEYVARNRRLLLFFLLLPATIPAIVLASFQYDTAAYRSPEFAFIFAFIIPSIIAIASYGVIVTQGSPARVFRLPISNTTIANLFFWGGALLVGIQVALLIAILNKIFDTALPLVSSTLFAIVCWGVYQPVCRDREFSLLTIVKLLVVVPPLLFWFVWRNHLWLFNEGDTESVSHYWFELSTIDVAITVGTLAASYVLTVWRISQDRCGRKWSIHAGNNYDLRESYLADLIFSSRSFSSKSQASLWFEFRSRVGLLPTVMIPLLLGCWLLAVVIGYLVGDVKSVVSWAFRGTFLACYVQVLVATLMAIKGLKMTTASRSLQLPDFGLMHYPFLLPNKTADVARSIINSSAISVSISTAAIAISFGVVGLLREVAKIEYSEAEFEGLGLGVVAALHVVFSMIASFAALNYVISLISFNSVELRSKYRAAFWVLDLLFVSVVVSLVFAPSTFMLVFIIALVFCQLVYCTYESLRLRDVSYRAAAVIWGLGSAGIGLLVFSGLPVASFLIGLACLSILLAMIPVFGIPVTLRRARAA